MDIYQVTNQIKTHDFYHKVMTDAYWKGLEFYVDYGILYPLAVLTDVFYDGFSDYIYSRIDDPDENH